MRARATLGSCNPDFVAADLERVREALGRVRIRIQALEQKRSLTVERLDAALLETLAD